MARAGLSSEAADRLTEEANSLIERWAVVARVLLFVWGFCSCWFSLVQLQRLAFCRCFVLGALGVLRVLRALGVDAFGRGGFLEATHTYY
jgi:hypothetical protein